MIREEWVDIIGYENMYQVSNTGNVRSLDRVTKTVSGQRIYKGRILSLAEHSAGYLVVNLRLGAKGGVVHYVHRLVAAAFLEKSKLFVNHKDLDKKNNSIDNLEYVSNKENLLHAYKNGVKVGKTILDAKQRKEIRELRKTGIKLKVLANKYNVSESAISEVYRGTTWGWEK